VTAVIKEVSIRYFLFVCARVINISEVGFDHPHVVRILKENEFPTVRLVFSKLLAIKFLAVFSINDADSLVSTLHNRDESKHASFRVKTPSPATDEVYKLQNGWLSKRLS